jgi:hypothetical protein
MIASLPLSFIVVPPELGPSSDVITKLLGAVTLSQCKRLLDSSLLVMLKTIVADSPEVKACGLYEFIGQELILAFTGLNEA